MSRNLGCVKIPTHNLSFKLKTQSSDTLWGFCVSLFITLLLLFHFLAQADLVAHTAEAAPHLLHTIQYSFLQVSTISRFSASPQKGHSFHRTLFRFFFLTTLRSPYFFECLSCVALFSFTP